MPRHLRQSGAPPQWQADQDERADESFHGVLSKMNCLVFIFELLSIPYLVSQQMQ
jgi:hypothetical protein